jgi:hypothetical protein
MYSSATTVWFDSPLPSTSSIDQQTWNAPTPATQANSLLKQLLGTRAFLIKVGRRGPIEDYVVRKAKQGSTRAAPLPAAMVDEEIVRTLSPSLSSTVVGNQVLRLDMTSDDPTVLQGTLDAVVQQYLQQVTTERRGRLEAVVEYYKPLLTDAAESMARARGDALVYFRSHPEAALGVTDPQYNALVGAASGAQSEYEDIEKYYSQANHALALADASMSSRVIDPATKPVAFSIKKKAIFGGMGGLLLGGMVSLLGLAVLTALDTSPRTSEEIESSAQRLRVIGTIGEVPSRAPRRRSAP